MTDEPLSRRVVTAHLICVVAPMVDTIWCRRTHMPFGDAIDALQRVPLKWRSELRDIAEIRSQQLEEEEEAERCQREIEK